MATLTHQQQSQAEYFNAKYSLASVAIDVEHYDKPRFGPWNPYWHLYNFVRELRQAGEQRLLNVGCGTGADALRYAKLGYDVEGIDISDRAVETARIAAEQYSLTARARFSVQPGESLIFPDESFDIVVGVNVLHHMDIPAAIPEMSRVLKRGGIAIFKEPLSTPRRDRVLRAPPFTWLVTKGTKNRITGERYGYSEGERNLDRRDFAVLRENFIAVSIKRWRVLSCMSIVVSNRPKLERWDWQLFRLMPFIRRFGDQAVILAHK